MAKVDANHLASGDGYEPQRENNFYLSISGLPGVEFDIVMLAIRNVSVPGHKVDKVEVRWGNEVRFISGNVTVENMVLKCRDMVDRDVRKVLLKWFWKVYDPNTGYKGLAADYKKIGAVHLFAPDGVNNERVADLVGVWPLGEPPSALTMDSQNPLDIDVELAIDKVKWNLT